MSDQNPIHRDRGRRDQGGQPYADHREAYAEKEAKIERKAPFPDEGGPELSEEEQRKLDEQAAADRFAEIGQDVRDEPGTTKEEEHGN